MHESRRPDPKTKYMYIVEDQTVDSELSLRDLRISYTSYNFSGINFYQEDKSSNNQLHGVEL